MPDINRLDFEHQKKMLHFFKKDLVFFDLETTGLSPAKHFIIEIGAAKITQSGEFHTFQQLVHPPIPIPERSEDIHGISNNDVADAPDAKQALKLFFEFIQGSDLVAHNAMFDLGFVIKESQLHHLKLPKLDVFDSLKFARSIYAKSEERPENFKLPTLANYIDFTYNSHRALDDSLATLFFWNHCVQKHGESKIKKATEKSQIFSTHKVKEYQIQNHSKYQLLGEIIETQDKAIIIYNGGSKKGQERPIKPIALIPLPNQISLYAHCLIDDVYKTFSLEKIDLVKKA